MQQYIWRKDRFVLILPTLLKSDYYCWAKLTFLNTSIPTKDPTINDVLPPSPQDEQTHVMEAMVDQHEQLADTTQAPVHQPVLLPTQQLQQLMNTIHN